MLRGKGQKKDGGAVKLEKSDWGGQATIEGLWEKSRDVRISPVTLSRGDRSVFIAWGRKKPIIYREGKGGEARRACDGRIR